MSRLTDITMFPDLSEDAQNALAIPLAARLAAESSRFNPDERFRREANRQIESLLIQNDRDPVGRLAVGMRETLTAARSGDDRYLRDSVRILAQNPEEAHRLALGLQSGAFTEAMQSIRKPGLPDALAHPSTIDRAMREIRVQQGIDDSRLQNDAFLLKQNLEAQSDRVPPMDASHDITMAESDIYLLSVSKHRGEDHYLRQEAEQDLGQRLTYLQMQPASPEVQSVIDDIRMIREGAIQEIPEPEREGPAGVQVTPEMAASLAEARQWADQQIESAPEERYRSKSFAVYEHDDGSLLVRPIEQGVDRAEGWTIPAGEQAQRLLSDIAETNVKDPFQRQWMDNEIAAAVASLEPEISQDLEADLPAKSLPLLREQEQESLPVALGAQQESVVEQETGASTALVAGMQQDAAQSLVPGDQNAALLMAAKERAQYQKFAPDVIDAEYVELSGPEAEEKEPAVGQVGPDLPKLEHLPQRERVGYVQFTTDLGADSPQSSPAEERVSREAERPDPAIQKAMEDLERMATGKGKEGWVPPMPKRVAIGDFRPEALSPRKAQNPYTPVRFLDAKGKHVMTDHGHQINVRATSSAREQVLLAALKEGQERFGEPVRIAGNPIFMAKMAKLAVENGIEVRPDGPFKAFAERELAKGRAQELGSGTIGGEGRPVPEEKMHPTAGKFHFQPLSVPEDGEIVIKHAGREKVLNMAMPPEQREILRANVGKSVEMQVSREGNVRVRAVERARGREVARGMA